MHPFLETTTELFDRVIYNMSKAAVRQMVASLAVEPPSDVLEGQRFSKPRVA